MSRLDLLNVFVNDRLTAAGEEIIRAVRDALVEYQREILRSKEENERLRRLLNVAMQRLLQQQQQQEEEEEEEEEEVAELSVLQPLDDGQRCERTSSMEPLLQVKEEPELRRTQTECSHEKGEAEEESSGRTESPALPPQEDGRPHEWRSSVRLLPQVKEEPALGNIRADCSHVAKMSEEGTRSGSELLQRLRPPPAETVSSRHAVPSTQLTQMQDKTQGDRKEPLADSSASLATDDTDCSEAQRESHSRAAQSDRTQRAERPLKGPLRSNGKQNTHVLQIKNVKSLKSPLPRSPLPSQGIQRWHSCEECGKGFSFACQLEVHMRWHTKEKPYSCTVCRKSFTTVSMLKRHHRIHTGEKPFRCHVCGKCFNQSAHLNTHFRLHTRERASWNRASHSK